MRDANLKNLGPIGVLWIALLTQAACGSQESATASAVAVDRTTQALTIGQLASVNGTYGALCRARAGAWSVAIATGATLDHTALSVVLNDSACVLTMTSLHTDTGDILAMPAIMLTASYQATPSAFGSPAAFYANAKLNAVNFAANFQVNIIFSNDSSLATMDNIASLATVVATATAAGSVPAPNYTLDVSGLSVITDASNIVQTVSGAAILTTGSVPGQQYLVVSAVGPLGPYPYTYAAIDTAFKAGTPTSISSTILAAQFVLVGGDLTTPQVRTVIVANAASGFVSYEAFKITFHPDPAL